jgi:hypothetical protein
VKTKQWICIELQVEYEVTEDSVRPVDEPYVRNEIARLTEAELERAGVAACSEFDAAFPVRPEPWRSDERMQA